MIPEFYKRIIYFTDDSSPVVRCRVLWEKSYTAQEGMYGRLEFSWGGSGLLCPGGPDLSIHERIPYARDLVNDPETFDHVYHDSLRWGRCYNRQSCPHQIRMGWDHLKFNPDRPTGEFVQTDEGMRYNTLVSYSKRDSQKGLYGEPCPECGHKYGNRFKEPVPTEVVEYLGGLGKVVL